MKVINHLPNTLTCSNLLCGCLGVVFCLENRTVPIAYFVWAAGVFDFFDGMAARALRVSSPIGKELDSLADVVSFGLLPALVMYKMMQASANEYLPYLSFMIAVCSALRLAVFNIDETQHFSFKGLNTPANSIFITSLPFVHGEIGSFIRQDWVLVAITIIFSLLLVSRMDMIAFKFTDFTWQHNKLRFTFLALSVFLIATLGFSALPLVILLYLAFSLIGKVLKLS